MNRAIVRMTALAALLALAAAACGEAGAQEPEKLSGGIAFTRGSGASPWPLPADEGENRTVWTTGGRGGSITLETEGEERTGKILAEETIDITEGSDWVEDSRRDYKVLHGWGTLTATLDEADGGALSCEGDVNWSHILETAVRPNIPYAEEEAQGTLALRCDDGSIISARLFEPEYQWDDPSLAMSSGYARVTSWELRGWMTPAS